jgi:uncharacterized integral membrane protein
MGERQIFQPLTREDTVTVVLYRAGIVLSTVVLSGLAYLLATAPIEPASDISRSVEIAGYAFAAAIGLCVFFIHLYVRAFKKFLIGLYLFSLLCLGVLFVIGRGSLADGLVQVSYGPLFLLPLSGCLGFVTAKEAFCFQLVEGYVLALLMPLFLLLAAGGLLPGRSAAICLILIAGLLVLFTLRKVFQPLAYDIGDKSAYQ